MANAGWDKGSFNEKHPFGKGATVISKDNYTHAQMRRAARARIDAGQGQPADYELVAGAEALIQNILGGSEDD